MTELREVGFRHHEGVATATEVCVVFNFFGEEVAGVDDARNVSNFDCFVLVFFANAVFMKVDVFCAFEGDGRGPVAGGFVVVVYGDAVECVWKS